MAARSEARTVFARPSTGVVGSNSTQVMDACVRFYFVSSCVCTGLGDGLIPFPRSRTDCTGLRSWKKRLPRPNKRACESLPWKPPTCWEYRWPGNGFDARESVGKKRYSGLCVYPRKLIPQRKTRENYDLCAANGTTIPTYGWLPLSLNLGFHMAIRCGRRNTTSHRGRLPRTLWTLGGL
jgi:hypothetical protein